MARERDIGFGFEFLARGHADADQARGADRRGVVADREARVTADVDVIEAELELGSLEFDQRRRQFYARVAPILVSLMDRYGAKAIFDENSVLLADQSLNITEAVIAEIDAQAPPATPEAPAAPPEAPAPQEQAPAPPAEAPDGE